MLDTSRPLLISTSPHAHFGFFPGIGVTMKAIGDQMVGVGWLLGKEITPEQGLGGMMPQAA